MKWQSRSSRILETHEKARREGDTATAYICAAIILVAMWVIARLAGHSVF